jgi:hypothetical protein
MTDEFMHWRKGSHELYAFGRVIPCSCDVRNEVNGRRHDDQVARSIPDNQPYQPRTFPKGLWEVSKPLARENKALAPYFIPTDAWQELPVWELKNGRYYRATAEKVIDRAYGLHHSQFDTTLGCIKITNRDDLLWLVDRINDHLAIGRKVFLEVHL